MVLSELYFLSMQTNFSMPLAEILKNFRKWKNSALPKICFILRLLELEAEFLSLNLKNSNPKKSQKIVVRKILAPKPIY